MKKREKNLMIFPADVSKSIPCTSMQRNLSYAKKKRNKKRRDEKMGFLG
jgi:hypothetical protein